MQPYALKKEEKKTDWGYEEDFKMAAEKKNVATILRTFSLKIYVHCRMSRHSVANQPLTFRFSVRQKRQNSMRVLQMRTKL